MGDDQTARITGTRVLAQTAFGRLTESQVLYRRRDGHVQELRREAYDHGDGVAILLHDPGRDCVLLVRQWRFGAFAHGGNGWLLEVPAGLLDGRDPEAAIRAETLEEVGVRVGAMERVGSCYTSPGSVTERVTLFRASYDLSHRVADGGGLPGEGEDIEIVELPAEQALTMLASGLVEDAKTMILLLDFSLRRR